jgi:YhcN/YlaJ family sporulation lipoprotein
MTFVLFFFVFSVLFAAAGCGQNRAAPSPSPQNFGMPNAAPSPQAAQADEGVQPYAQADPNAIASHLEMLARGVEGVEGANCVVFGNYAIVGIDVDPKMERSRVGTVKYAVAEAFRKDPYGINAIVTADIDLAQRIREIRADIRQGRPVAGFAEELADIIGRLVPQVPRNIIPPQGPENTGAPAADAAGDKGE